MRICISLGCILIFLFPVVLHTQENPVLDWPAFRAQVLQYHPEARQADLFPARAAAAVLRAKGGFDPKAYTDFSSKNFNEKNYFRYTEAGVKWPLWLGIEIKGNYNLATGDFLNPESKLPSGGQLAAGLNWTLGQGLFIDERRAALRQSRIGLEQADAERASALNGLVFESAKAYWSWAIAGQQLRIFEEALRQAQIRHAGLLESLRQGDKPAIDTLESFIQVQNRQIDVTFARIDVQNAAIGLTNYLWTPENTPVRPESLPASPVFNEAETYPEIAVPDAESLLQNARTQHPEIRQYTVKQQLLAVERRIKAENLKPVVNLNYQLLGNNWQFFSSPGAEGIGVLANDIKWGIEFSFPLFNRKARGSLQETRLKIVQTELGLQQKQLELETKIRQYANEMNTLVAQIGLYRQITANYRALLDAENEKFRFGESSVFLINTREQRWLDAQVKYLKLISEYRKAEAGLKWAAGQW